MLLVTLQSGFLFGFCLLIFSATGNGGIIQKRLQHFKNLGNNDRSVGVSLERKLLHRICHEPHIRHQNWHFKRAVHHEPFNRISSPLFYYGREPFYLSYGDIHKNNFIPYFLSKYYYLPLYVMKPLMHSPPYPLKPMYRPIYQRPYFNAPGQHVQFIKPNIYPYPIAVQLPSSDIASSSQNDNKNPHEQELISQNVVNPILSHDDKSEDSIIIDVEPMTVQHSNNNSIFNTEDEKNDKTESFTSDYAFTTYEISSGSNAINNAGNLKDHKSTYLYNSELTTQPYKLDSDDIDKSVTINSQTTQLNEFNDYGKEDITSSTIESIFITGSQDNFKFEATNDRSTTPSSFEEDITEQGLDKHEQHSSIQPSENEDVNIGPESEEGNREITDDDHESSTENLIRPQDSSYNAQRPLWITDETQINEHSEYESEGETEKFESYIIEATDFNASSTERYFEITTTESSSRGNAGSLEYDKKTNGSENIDDWKGDDNIPDASETTTQIDSKQYVPSDLKDVLDEETVSYLETKLNNSNNNEAEETFKDRVTEIKYSDENLEISTIRNRFNNTREDPPSIRDPSLNNSDSDKKIFSHTSMASEEIPLSNYHKELNNQENFQNSITFDQITTISPILGELAENDRKELPTLLDLTDPIERTSPSPSSMFTTENHRGGVSDLELQTSSYDNTPPTQLKAVENPNEVRLTTIDALGYSTSEFSPPASVFAEDFVGKTSEATSDSELILTTPEPIHKDPTKYYTSSTSEKTSITDLESAVSSADDYIYVDFPGNADEIFTILEDSSNGMGIIDEPSSGYGKGKLNSNENDKTEYRINIPIRNENETVKVENATDSKSTGAEDEGESYTSRESHTFKSSVMEPTEEVNIGKSELDKANSFELETDTEQRTSDISDKEITSEKYSLLLEESELNKIHNNKGANDVLHKTSFTTSRSDLVETNVIEGTEATTLTPENGLRVWFSNNEGRFEEPKIESDEYSEEMSSSNKSLLFFPSLTNSAELQTIIEYSNNSQGSEGSSTTSEFHRNEESNTKLISMSEPTTVDVSDGIAKDSFHFVHKETPTTSSMSLVDEEDIVSKAAGDEQITTDSALRNKYTLSFYDDPDKASYTSLLSQDFKTEVNTATAFSVDELEIQKTIEQKQNGTHELDDSSHLKVGNTLTLSYEEDYTTLPLESSSEINNIFKTEPNSDQYGLDGESFAPQIVDPKENRKAALNQAGLLTNTDPVMEHSEQTTSAYSLLREYNIEQTTVIYEASSENLNVSVDNSNAKQEAKKTELGAQLGAGNAFEELSSNDDVVIHNPIESYVSNGMHKNADKDADYGVLSVYEELDTYPSSKETDVQNKEYIILENKNNNYKTPEESESPTETKDDDNLDETTDKSLWQTIDVSNTELKPENDSIIFKQIMDTKYTDSSTNEMDFNETATEGLLSNFIRKESNSAYNGNEEIELSPSDSLESGYSPFHLNLLNYKKAIPDSLNGKFKNKSSVVEEIMFYNMKNLEGSGDGLFINVNEETDGIGLLAVNEYINTDDDHMTDDHDLTRSIRYNPNSGYIKLNVRTEDRISNGSSTESKHIMKRDVMKANISQILIESEESLIEENAESKPDASEVLALLEKGSKSSFQGDEAYNADEDYENVYDNDYENPSSIGLAEVENEEDETKLNYESGPSIMDLISLRSRLNKRL